MNLKNITNKNIKKYNHRHSKDKRYVQLKPTLGNELEYKQSEKMCVHNKTRKYNVDLKINNNFEPKVYHKYNLGVNQVRKYSILKKTKMNKGNEKSMSRGKYRFNEGKFSVNSIYNQLNRIKKKTKKPSFKTCNYRLYNSCYMMLKKQNLEFLNTKYFEKVDFNKYSFNQSDYKHKSLIKENQNLFKSEENHIYREQDQILYLKRSKSFSKKIIERTQKQININSDKYQDAKSIHAELLGLSNAKHNKNLKKKNQNKILGRCSLSSQSQIRSLSKSKEDSIDMKERIKRYDAKIEQYDEVLVSVTLLNKNKLIPNPINTFEDMCFNKQLRKNMISLLFRKPTPIQRYAIPMIQAGLDVLATAQTGSGKTLAFLCPIISSLLNGEEVIRPFFVGRNAMVSPLALLIAPTRELVIQIDEQTWKLTNGTNLRSFAVFGGINFNDQAKQLSKGQIDILSATPGRLIDMCSRNKISLNFVKYLTLDEADNILDLGLEKQTREIILKRDLPDRDKRITIMFSATFPSKIKELARQFLRRHIYLKVGEIGGATKRIKQSIKWVQEEFKKSVLFNDLKLLPDQKGKVIIFVAKRLTADSVSRFLIGKGLLSESIHGKQDQWQREECILKFKDDQFQYLVATSVVSRGLDFSDICAVFNFDFPTTIQDYMHRIGRTGRIGHKGIAISYFNDTNRSLYSSLKYYLSENHLPIPYWFRNY